MPRRRVMATPCPTGSEGLRPASCLGRRAPNPARDARAFTSDLPAPAARGISGTSAQIVAKWTGQGLRAVTL